MVGMNDKTLSKWVDGRPVGFEGVFIDSKPYLTASAFISYARCTKTTASKLLNPLPYKVIGVWSWGSVRRQCVASLEDCLPLLRNRKQFTSDEQLSKLLRGQQ